MERGNRPPTEAGTEKADVRPDDRLARIKRRAREDAFKAKAEFKKRPDLIEPQQLIDLAERYKAKSLVQFRGFTMAETGIYDDEFRDAWLSPARDV